MRRDIASQFERLRQVNDPRYLLYYWKIPSQSRLKYKKCFLSKTEPLQKLSENERINEWKQNNTSHVLEIKEELLDGLDWN